MSKHQMSKASAYPLSVRRPTQVPIGLQLARVSRDIGRAFDQALSDAGGSLPVWLVLLNLKLNPSTSQRELADAVGLREATVTHHLNAMEGDGLLSRRRDPTNRRSHIVEVSADGEALFSRLRSAAISFDSRLRAGVAEKELDELRTVLNRLVANLGVPVDGI